MNELNLQRQQAIIKLLKGIETGDPDSVAVIHPDTYIQHNPQTHTGREGLAALFAELAKTGPRVNIVRIFSDGDYVFAHTEYDFDTRRIGFEIFRFEGEHTVEHWDNIQPRLGPNHSKHSMVDGVTTARDHLSTDSNRQQARDFVEEVLIERQTDRLFDYIDTDKYVEHNPDGSDDLSDLQLRLFDNRSDGNHAIRYRRMHRALAEGSFVLTVSEGLRASVATAFYDLFRFDRDRIVEHWDTTETIPPREQWKNSNGKF